MKVVFTDKFYEQFCYWKDRNQKVVEKIERLITSISENPFKGIGKPEPLCYQLTKCWSRRINKEHRIVYKVENNTVTLLSCRFHYD